MSDTTAEFAWMRTRAKAWPLPGSEPVQGFGPEGKHTLYLPSGAVARKYVFKDGVPVELTTENPAGDDPEIEALRVAAMRTLTEGAGITKVIGGELALVTYAAALVRKNYNVSDDDLTFLFSSKNWAGHIMRHLLGGDEGIETWAAMGRHISADTQDAGPAAELNPGPWNWGEVSRIRDGIDHDENAGRRVRLWPRWFKFWGANSPRQAR